MSSSEENSDGNNIELGIDNNNDNDDSGNDNNNSGKDKNIKNNFER